MRFLLCWLLFAAAAVAQKTGAIEGRVVATDGSPVPRATVRIQGMSQGGATPTVYIELTDKNGAFRVENVPAGTYLPTATRSGFQVSTGAAPSMPVYVTEGKTTSGAQIRLARLGSVSGVVVDADGEPIQGVQVILMRTNYLMGRMNLGGAGSAVTDDQGQFRIVNAQPGRYRLQASMYSSQFAPSFGTEIRGRSAEVSDLPTFYPNASDPAKATAINLQTQAITGLKVQMRRGRTYHVQGTVAIPANAAQRPQVMVSSKGISNSFFVSVNPNGEFVITGLAPGEYVLTVRGSELGAAQTMGRAEITVKDADLTNVSLRLMTPQEFTGSIQVEGVTDMASFFAGINATRPGIAGPVFGQLQRGPMITLFPLEPGPIGQVQVIMNTDGTFRAPAVIAGSYGLNLGNLGPGMFVKQAKLDGKDLTGKRLEFGEGKHTLELLLSTASATVTYQLTRATPVVMWPVVPDLLTQTGNVFLNTGNMITNIPPGEYFVATWEESPAADLARAPDFLRRFNNLATRVTLQPGTSTPLQPKMIPKDALQKVLEEF